MDKRFLENNWLMKVTDNPIIFICILCFLLRLIFCFFIFPIIGLPNIESVDIDHHGAIASSIYHGRGSVAASASISRIARGSLYPLFLAFIYTIFGGEDLLFVQFAQSLLGAFTCFIVYVIANKIFGKKTALISALIVTFYPPFIWYTARIWTETMLTFLLSIVVLCLIQFLSSPTKKKALLLGAMLGFVNLCKPLLIFLPLLLLFVLVASYGTRKKEIIVNILLIAIPMFLVISPVIYRNYKISGHSVFVETLARNMIGGDLNIEKGIGLKEKRLPSLRETLVAYDSIIRSIELKSGKRYGVAEQDAVIVNYLFHKYLSSPLFLFKKMAIQSVQFWYLGGSKWRCLLFAIMQLSLLIPGLFGIFFAIKNRLFVLPLLLIIFYFVIVHSLVITSARYSIPIMPYVAMFAAYALNSMLKKTHKP